MGILAMFVPFLLYGDRTYHSGTNIKGNYSDYVGKNGRIDGSYAFGVGTDIRITGNNSVVIGMGYNTASNSVLFGKAATDNITVANMFKCTLDSTILPPTRFTSTTTFDGTMAIWDNLMMEGVAKTFLIGDGGLLKFGDGTEADTVSIYHDGTDLVMTGITGTTMFELEGMDIELKNGGKIENSTAALLTFTEATVDVVGILTASSIVSDGDITATGNDFIFGNGEKLCNETNGEVQLICNGDAVILSKLTLTTSLDSSAMDDADNMVISFDAKDDQNNASPYGKIICKFDDVSDGSEDAAFEWQIMKGGSAAATKMELNENGLTITDDLTVTGGDITGANGNAIDIGEATDGTITFSRDDAGTVTLTSADNDANAALTIVAGGTGALALGDVGSTSEIISSDWTISTAGVCAKMGSYTFDNGLIIDNGTDNQLKFTENSEDLILAFATDAINISSSTGVATVDFGTINLATDELDVSDGNITNVGQIDVDLIDADGALITIGDDDETIIINSSDWDIDSLGALTGIEDVTFDNGGLLDNPHADTTGLTDANILVDGKLVVTGEVAATGAITTAAATKTSANVGALAGTNVTVVEYGEGTIHQTVLTLAATPVTLTDETGVVLYGGQKIYDFEAGNIFVMGAVMDLDVTVDGNFSATAQGDIGLGTITASNDATLASTEQDIVPTTAIAALVDSSGATDAITAAAIAPIDGTGTDVDVFLNYLWDDSDHNGGSMIVTGTITLTWINLGDK